jgi:hypothetical protein
MQLCWTGSRATCGDWQCVIVVRNEPITFTPKADERADGEPDVRGGFAVTHRTLGPEELAGGTGHLAYDARRHSQPAFLAARMPNGPKSWTHIHAGASTM